MILEAAGTLAVVVGLCCIVGLFVAAQFALVAVRISRVQEMVGEGIPGAKHVDNALRHLDGHVAACQLMITATGLALGWIGVPLLAAALEPVLGPGVGSGVGSAVSFILLVALLTIGGELVAKGLALQYPERAALLTALAVRIVRALTRPVLWVLNEMSWLWLAIFGVSRQTLGTAPIAPEELQLVMQASRVAGAIEADQEDMLQRVLRFAHLRAANILTPRASVAAVPVEASVEEALTTVRVHRHSRYPVYAGDLDTIVGVLHARDLVVADHDALLSSLLRPPLIVPEQIDVDDLLRLMRRRSVQFAIAVDEHGSTAGIVTLENIVEEIVGELQDEFEVPERAPVEHGDGQVQIEGSESVYVLQDLLGLVTPAGPYTTVAGYLLDQLRDMPREGGVIEVADCRFTIVELRDRRIARVAAERKARWEQSSGLPRRLPT